MKVVLQPVSQLYVNSFDCPPQMIHFVVKLASLFLKLFLQIFAFQIIELQNWLQLFQLMHRIGISFPLSCEMREEIHCFASIECVLERAFDVYPFWLQISEKRRLSQSIVRRAKCHHHSPSEVRINVTDGQNRLFLEMALSKIFLTTVISLFGTCGNFTLRFLWGLYCTVGLEILGLMTFALPLDLADFIGNIYTN